ncbi:MAG: hypothetical protein JWO81_2319 [Alphaproteobacteria bacterium]|nr:hypothetical protein [Alphaproteobacteria bacterium]
MRIRRAIDAIEKGCCLELYYQQYSLIVEPHAVGLDASGRPFVLAVERYAGRAPVLGQWLFLPLDTTRKVAVSGYFSEAPRPGYRPDDPRFDRILSQLPELQPAAVA